MISLNPILTGGVPNPNVAYCNAWIPISNNVGRPLFAQATYLANPEDIKVSLSAGNINVSLDELELNTNEIESLLRTSNSNLTGLDLGVITFNRQLSGQVLTLNTQLTGQILTFNRQLTGQVDTFNRQLTGQVLTTNTLLNSQLGQSGFVFLVGGESALGEFSTIQVVSACKISGLSANNTSVGSLYNFELPANFIFYGPITGLTLAYGAVIVYKL